MRLPPTVTRLLSKISAPAFLGADGQAALGTPIFELHAGFTPSAPVQTRSLRLAQTIATLITQVSPGLPAPQIYSSRGGTHDPAESRSDHYSFQLFVGPGPGAPISEAEPGLRPRADDHNDIASLALVYEISELA